MLEKTCKKKHHGKHKKKVRSHKSGLRNRRKTHRRFAAASKQSGGAVNDSIEKKLCTLALSDARHDFKDQAMIENARTMLPTGIAGCNVNAENEYLYNYLGISRNRRNTFDIPDDSELLKKYEYTLIEYKKDFHELFELKALDNLFLVVDTYSEGLSYVLSHPYKNNTSVKYHWVQNKQTLFDPAGKTNEKTKRGKQIFFKRWPEDERNPNVTFCWEAGSSIDRYAPWGEKNNRSVNRLFFSNSEIYQLLYNNDPNKFKKQETKCIMRTPENKIIVFNKKMASINAIFSIKANYELFESVQKDIKKLIDDGGAAGEHGRFLARHHCIAKRLGDQGQALSCLKPEMELKYHDAITGEVAEHNIVSNGNHAFVTIDLLAFASALLYEAPIVIYCFRHGPLGVFIRRDIMEPSVIIAGLKQKYIQVLAELESVRTEYQATFAEYGKLTYDIKMEIKAGLAMPITSELEYRQFMKHMMEVSYKAAVLSELERVKIMRVPELPADINGFTEADIRRAYKYINDMRNSISSYKYGIMCMTAIGKNYIRIDETDVNMRIINKSNIYRDMVRFMPRLLVASTLADTLIPYVLSIYREINAVFDKLGAAFIDKMISLGATLDNNYNRAIHLAFIKAGAEHPRLIDEEGRLMMREDNNDNSIPMTPRAMKRPRLRGGVKGFGLSDESMLEIVAKSALYIYIACKKRDIFIKNYKIDELMQLVHAKIVDDIDKYKGVVGEDGVMSEDGASEDGASEDAVMNEEITYYVDSIEPQMMFDNDLYSLYKSLEEDFPLMNDRMIAAEDEQLQVQEHDEAHIEFPMELINKLYKFISVGLNLNLKFKVNHDVAAKNIRNYSKTMRTPVRRKSIGTTFRTKRAAPYSGLVQQTTVGSGQNDSP